VAPTTTALLKLHLLQGWGCWNDLEYKDYLTKNEELSPYSQINSHKAVEEELVRESTRLNLELEQQKAVFENMNRNLQQEVDNLKLRSIEDEEIYDSTFYEYETKFASLQADLSVANDAYEKIKREYDETIFVLRELKCEMAAMTRNNEGRKTSSRELRDRVNRLEKREEELSARNTYLQESLDESNLQKNELKIILDDKVKATLAIEDELINVKAKYDSLDAIARDLQLENLHLRGEILKLQGRLPLKSEVKHYRTRSVSHVREEAYKESILAEEKDKVRKRVKNIKFQDLLMKATWIILLKEGIKLAALKEVICEELVVGTSKHKEFIRTFTDFELESLSFDQ
jgi:chromosome segregation ATPase